jgi:hypothetical protein
MEGPPARLAQNFGLNRRVGLKAEGKLGLGISSELGIFPPETGVKVQLFGRALRPCSRNGMWY